ncbi:MAG: type II toxin-antitoxin system VapC family toxin [Planctomycetes bacterium]|nr:type II toxin-antitoxin system VapC family toxin [Planctomycetota bacterium]
MRCLPARRRRAGNADRNTEMLVFATLQDEVRQGVLLCRPMPEGTAAAALNLISMAPEAPLSTLDAFHLAIAGAIQAELLAGADRVTIKAAAAPGIGVVRFDGADAGRPRC